MFIKRPSKNDTENDLFREQEKFFEMRKAQQIEPSVSEIVKNTSQTLEPNLKVESIEYVNDLPIIEKNFSSLKQLKMPEPTHVAFPKLTKRKSLTFAKQNLVPNFDSTNDQRIKNMSKEEIIQAKEELMNHLSKESIDFLIKRAKEKQKTIAIDKFENQEDDLVDIFNPSKEIKTKLLEDFKKDLPISSSIVQQNQWLNMNVLEEEKLEWTKPLLKTDKQSNTARFSFSGHLIMEEISWKKGLHHHGEEPEKAGYTLSEIFIFIQSSLSSQKVIGLRTLGRIMQKVHQGYYDQCFNCSLAKEILDKSEILLIVRTCLDENCETVNKEALECLQHLICNTLTDEVCLDQLFVMFRFHSFKPYYLEPKIKELDLNLEGITDQELIKLDVIRALLRCNILSRFRFVIEKSVNVKKEKLISNNIFNILLRIARHSKSSIRAIIDSPHLLEIIIENFLASKISSSSLSFNPNPKAVKLFRIIFESSCENTLNILSRFPQLIDSFQVYLTIDPSSFQDNQHISKYSAVLQVGIETLRVWSVLLDYNLTLIKKKFFEIIPVIFRQLQHCLTLNIESSKYDLNYAATLIKCIHSASIDEKNLFSGCKSLIQTLIFQLIQIINENEKLPSFDVLIIILSGIQYLIDNNFTSLQMNENFLNKLVESAEIMKNFSKRLKKCSYLCQSRYSQNGCLRDSSSLPSFGSLYFGGTEIKLIELVQKDSALPLLDAILLTLKKYNENNLIFRFLDNQYILEFIDFLNSFYVIGKNNIFKEIEIHTLYQLSILSQVLSNSWLSYYKLTLTLIHSITQIQKKEHLLNLIVFSPLFFEKIAQVNLSKLQLSSFQQVKEVYFKYSSFDNPIWIFDPIIECFKSKSSDEFGIKLNLEFISILIKLDQVFFSQIVPHLTQFGLFSTVFIIEGRVYMNQYIEKILHNLLKYLIEQKCFIFSCFQKLPHISNFQALFKMFISEYEFCTSRVFTNYLLLFLQQQSDSEFRKIFFSEHGSCLRQIFLKNDDIVLIKKCLFPLDTDITMIEIYLKGLLSGNITMSDQNPFYFIAVHHVHMALYNFENSKHFKNNQLFSKLLLSIELSKNEQLKYHLRKFLDSDLIQIFSFVSDIIYLYNS